MGHDNNLSIGVFIDGGYYAKINEGFTGRKEGISAHSVCLIEK